MKGGDIMFDMDKMADIYIKKQNGTATEEELRYFDLSLQESSFIPEYVISCIERYIKQKS